MLKIKNKFVAYTEKTKSSEYRKERRERLTIFGLFLAAGAAIIQSGVFYCQLKEMQKVFGPVEVTAKAAQQSADTARKALIDVERPVLLITMPAGAFKTKDIGFRNDLPSYVVVVKNVGKQAATIITGTANYIIQDNSELPPLTALAVADKTFCHIRIVGEIVLEANQTKAFICQRGLALSQDEIKGLEERNLFGFFRTAFVYSDPIGDMRVSKFEFVYLPLNAPNRDTPFVQVESDEEVLDKVGAKEQKNGEHKLESTMLKTYWRIDKENLEHPPQ
jgi:hypothetical protein